MVQFPVWFTVWYENVRPTVYRETELIKANIILQTVAVLVDAAESSQAVFEEAWQKQRNVKQSRTHRFRWVRGSAINQNELSRIPVLKIFMFLLIFCYE